MRIEQGRNCWVENLKQNNNTIGFSCGYVGTEERKGILFYLVLEYETCFYCFTYTILELRGTHAVINMYLWRKKVGYGIEEIDGEGKEF